MFRRKVDRSHKVCGVTSRGQSSCPSRCPVQWAFVSLVSLCTSSFSSIGGSNIRWGAFWSSCCSNLKLQKEIQFFSIYISVQILWKKLNNGQTCIRKSPTEACKSNHWRKMTLEWGFIFSRKLHFEFCCFCVFQYFFYWKEPG